ncbi:hypothetical protein MMPV_002610 [Pyropia vietnamensis]
MAGGRAPEAEAESAEAETATARARATTGAPVGKVDRDGDSGGGGDGDSQNGGCDRDADGVDGVGVWRGGGAARDAASATAAAERKDDSPSVLSPALPPLGSPSWSQSTGTPSLRGSSPFRRPHRPPRPPSTPRRRRVDSGGDGRHGGGSSGSSDDVGRVASAAPGGGLHVIGRVRAAATTAVVGAAVRVARRLPSCLRDSAQGRRSGGNSADDRGGGGGSRSGGGGSWGGWGYNRSDGDADSGSDRDVRVGEWEDPPDGGAKLNPPPSLPRASAGSSGRCAMHGSSPGGEAGRDGERGGNGLRVDPSQASSRRPSTLRFWEVVSDGRRRRRTATRVEILDAVHAAVRTARCGRCGGGADATGASTDSEYLRQVDPAFVAKPALWVRRNALILSLGGIRALILHDRLFLFDPDAPAVVGAYRVVAGRLTGLVTGAAAAGGAEGAGTPFEFLALEGLLIAVVVSLERSFGGVEPGLVDTLAALADDLTVGRLEELRASEQQLVTFQSDARAARRVLVDAMGDDLALAAMYLSDGAKHPGRRRNPLDHAEVEQLLEAYLQLVDDLATRATLLLRAIDDTETLIVIHLDILQNHLLLVALLISMASTVLAAGSTVTALFGMNLALPPAMATLPSSATYFWGVLAGLIGGMAAAFAALLGWGHAAGLMPRTPNIRTPWLLREVSAARRRPKEPGGEKGTEEGEMGEEAEGSDAPEYHTQGNRERRTAGGRRAPLAQLAAKARAWPHARKAELARRAAAAAGDALGDAGEALNEAGEALGAVGDALGAAEDALGVVGESLDAAVEGRGEEKGSRR